MADGSAGLCAACGEPLDPVFIAAGFTDHGGDCDPGTTR